LTENLTLILKIDLKMYSLKCVTIVNGFEDVHYKMCYEGFNYDVYTVALINLVKV